MSNHFCVYTFFSDRNQCGVVLVHSPLHLGDLYQDPQEDPIFCWSNFWVSKIRELADDQTTNIKLANPRVVCEDQKMDLTLLLPNLHQLFVPKRGQGCRYPFFHFYLCLVMYVQKQVSVQKTQEFFFVSLMSVQNISF